MVLDISAYSIRCLSSPFSAISRRFVIRAIVGDAILGLCGLLIALATTDALCWIVSVKENTKFEKMPARVDASQIGWKKIEFQLVLKNRFETLQELADINTMMETITDMIQKRDKISYVNQQATEIENIVYYTYTDDETAINGGKLRW